MESPKERIVMRDIDKLCKVFDDLNIEYAIKNDGEYQYLFIGERRDIHAMSKEGFETWEVGELGVLLHRHKFIEFENGKLVSYFNA